jgi:hypothetical protein
MSRLLLAAALLLSLATPAFAGSREDRVGVGNDIIVSAGETAGDIACAFCSVHVHGDVKGDVAIFMGSITVDSGHGISGDVAILGGDLNLGPESEVGGDVAIAAGDVNSAAGAMIHGAQTVLPGRFWLILPLAPFLILGGIIWLIVYLVRRNRYRFPVYPNGRGI